jgi:hypothetical protein
MEQAQDSEELPILARPYLPLPCGLGGELTTLAHKNE